MLILPEWNKPHIIESLTVPIVAEYFWAFSGPMMDFTLMPITYLEESAGPAIEIQIAGYSFNVPGNWNILVVDQDTSYLDAVPVANCALNDYSALLMSPYDSKPRSADIKIEGLSEHESMIHPMLPKGTMLCHPVGPDTQMDRIHDENILSACIGPYDLFSKYLNGKVVGDLY